MAVLPKLREQIPVCCNTGEVWTNSYCSFSVESLNVKWIIPVIFHFIIIWGCVFSPFLTHVKECWQAWSGLFAEMIPPSQHSQGNHMRCVWRNLECGLVRIQAKSIWLEALHGYAKGICREKKAKSMFLLWSRAVEPFSQSWPPMLCIGPSLKVVLVHLNKTGTFVPGRYQLSSCTWQEHESLKQRLLPGLTHMWGGGLGSRPIGTGQRRSIKLMME